MDAFAQGIIASTAVNYFTSFSYDVVKDFFSSAFRIKPELESQVRNAKSAQDWDRIFHDASGVIDAAAASGAITVDGAFIAAVRGIHFDHQHGTVTVGNSTLSSQLLVTGGGTNATGYTTISGSQMLSAGTRIDIGRGASIQISGGAQIRQS